MRYIIDYWLEAIRGKVTKKQLFKILAENYPPLISVVFTRECNMRCKHCIYPEASKEDILSNNLARIDRAIEAIHSTGVSDLIHVGRTLKTEHIVILKKYQDYGMSINLIDNGDAAQMIPTINEAGLFFDGGIDISIDGDRYSHDRQRCRGSYVEAVKNTQNLREIAGHISIVSTASALNYRNIVAGLMELHKILSFVKIFQITTTTPTRFHKQRMSLNEKEMRKMFEQFVKASEKSSKIRMLIYRLGDILAILPQLMKYGKPRPKYISLQWKIGEMVVEFFPQSIVTSEEFAIDANGKHFLPFGLGWHLADRPIEWEMRDDLILTDPDESYRQLVSKYRDTLGGKVFLEEKKVFKKFF